MQPTPSLDDLRQTATFTPARVAVWALVIPVHLITLGLILVAIWLALNAGGAMKALAVAPLLAAFAMRPRFGRRGSPHLMDEARYPETVSLVRDVAVAVGSPIPTRLEIGTEANAAVFQAGLTGRTLRIGAPLWVALTPQARVALIAHELGHLAHQDVRSGRFVGSAVHALAYWNNVLDVDNEEQVDLAHYDLNIMIGDEGTPRFVSLVARILATVMLPVRLLIFAWRWAIERVNAASGREMEAYADLAAVKAAGTDGVVSLLETLLAAKGLGVTINRAAITRTDLRAAITDWRTTLTDERRASARRGATLGRAPANVTHPATIDRIALVESVERTSAAVVIDQQRLDRLDTEWAEELDARLKELSYEFLAH